MSLPPPRNATETYLAAVHDRLGQILDRLPAPKQEPEAGAVELREPAAQGESTVQHAPAEPVPPAEKLTEPAPTRRRTTKKRTGGA